MQDKDTELDTESDALSSVASNPASPPPEVEPSPITPCAEDSTGAYYQTLDLELAAAPPLEHDAQTYTQYDTYIGDSALAQLAQPVSPYPRESFPNTQHSGQSGASTDPPVQPKAKALPHHLLQKVRQDQQDTIDQRKREVEDAFNTLDAELQQMGVEQPKRLKRSKASLLLSTD